MKKEEFIELDQKRKSKSIIILFVFLILIGAYLLLKINNLNFLGEKHRISIEPYLNTFENILIILIVFSLTYLFIINTKRLFKNYLERSGKSKKNIKLFLIVYEYCIWIIVIFITFSLILKQVGSLITSLGIIGFGLTLALQKPILNFAGWVTIIFGKVHHIGDVISINNLKGKVYDIRFMHTLISELDENGDPTGKSVSIPNEFVFLHPIINFNKGTDYIWDIITINIPYKSNWEKAVEIIRKTVQDYYNKKIKNEIKNVFNDSFKEYDKIIIRFGIQNKELYIKAKYMVDFNKANEVKLELTKIILKKFEEENILF